MSKAKKAPHKPSYVKCVSCNVVDTLNNNEEAHLCPHCLDEILVGIKAAAQFDMDELSGVYTIMRRLIYHCEKTFTFQAQQATLLDLGKLLIMQGVMLCDSPKPKKKKGT